MSRCYIIQFISKRYFWSLNFMYTASLHVRERASSPPLWASCPHAASHFRRRPRSDLAFMYLIAHVTFSTARNVCCSPALRAVKIQRCNTRGCQHASSDAVNFQMSLQTLRRSKSSRCNWTHASRPCSLEFPSNPPPPFSPGRIAPICNPCFALCRSPLKQFLLLTGSIAVIQVESAITGGIWLKCLTYFALLLDCQALP